MSASATRSFRVEEIWGTAIGVDIRDDVDPSVVDSVFDWFRRVDDLFSTWRPETEISRFGRRELNEDELSADVREVLALCDVVSVRSGGAFDITVGADPRVAPRPGLGPVDPSGLVKGWALDRAAGHLEARDVTSFSINAGGDVVIRGRPEPGQQWRVGIRHPWERHRVAAVLGGVDLGIATSGRYERGEHIVDPTTGRHPEGLMAVTVVADELAMADGYATAAVVLGREGMAWLASLGDVEGLGITESREVVTTPGLARYRR